MGSLKVKLKLPVQFQMFLFSIVDLSPQAENHCCRLIPKTSCRCPGALSLPTPPPHLRCITSRSTQLQRIYLCRLAPAAVIYTVILVFITQIFKHVPTFSIRYLRGRQSQHLWPPWRHLHRDSALINPLNRHVSELAATKWREMAIHL